MFVPPRISGRIPAAGTPTSRIGCAAEPDFVQRTAEYVALPSTSTTSPGPTVAIACPICVQVRVGPTWYVAASAAVLPATSATHDDTNDSSNSLAIVRHDIAVPASWIK